MAAPQPRRPLTRGHLFVDDVLVNTVTVNSPFNSKAVNNTLDFNLGMLARGTHTLRLETDSTSAITESNETDNEYIRTIFIIGLPPVVTTSTGSLNYTENDPATPVDANITVTDSDSPTLAGATISISAKFVPGEDMLFYNPADGITGTFVPTRACSRSSAMPRPTPIRRRCAGSGISILATTPRPRPAPSLSLSATAAPAARPRAPSR